MFHMNQIHIDRAHRTIVGSPGHRLAPVAPESSSTPRPHSGLKKVTRRHCSLVNHILRGTDVIHGLSQQKRKKNESHKYNFPNLHSTSVFSFTMLALLFHVETLSLVGILMVEVITVFFQNGRLYDRINICRSDNIQGCGVLLRFGENRSCVLWRCVCAMSHVVFFLFLFKFNIKNLNTT